MKNTSFSSSRLAQSLYKTIGILSTIFFLSACQEESKTYRTLCTDSDTSVENDIPKSGILWSLSTDDLKNIISLVIEESPRNIYVMHSITTCEMAFNDIKVVDNICKITLNAGAYGYATCSDGTQYNFGCYTKQCDQYFPFPFVAQE